MQNYKEKILKQLEYQKDYINQTTYENMSNCPLYYTPAS